MLTPLAAAVGDTKAVAAIFLLARAVLTLADAAVHVTTAFALLAACAAWELAAFAAAVSAAEAPAL